MHCLIHSGAFGVNAQSSAKERLAGLRKIVEGLHATSIKNGCLGGEPGNRQDAIGSRLARLEFVRGLPADLAVGALNELVAEYGDRPAAFGFLFALTAAGLHGRAGPVVLVAARRALADHGAPYGHGLAQLGLDLGRLILVETETDKEALWAMEETLRSGARPAMVAGALQAGLDLTASRRLNLAAEPLRTPLVLLRGGKGGAPSAAATRWRIAAAPAARDRFGALAGPRWHLTLERSRPGIQRGHGMSPPGSWLIEWSHVTYRFSVVAGLADCPPVAVAGLRRAG